MSYDTHVNIVFTGPGIVPAEVGRIVHPIDVAPTLSALLGLPPPGGAEGQVLSEVVRIGTPSSSAFSIVAGSGLIPSVMMMPARSARPATATTLG